MDEPLERPPDAGLEQDLRRLHVVRRVGREVLAPALADAGLGREVEHVRDAVEQRRQIGVLDRRLREAESLRAAGSPRGSLP